MIQIQMQYGSVGVGAGDAAKAVVRSLRTPTPTLDECIQRRKTD